MESSNLLGAYDSCESSSDDDELKPAKQTFPSSNSQKRHTSPSTRPAPKRLRLAASTDEQATHQPKLPLTPPIVPPSSMPPPPPPPFFDAPKTDTTLSRTGDIQRHNITARTQSHLAGGDHSAQPHARHNPLSSSSTLLVPPQVRSRRPNISTEDLTSYGCKTKHSKSTS